MADKKYYWIKLKDSMFTSDSIDFLMSQKDGAKYVVLYQMLCLETIKTNGELVRQIGEVIIQYDVDKIQRDCKYFDRDTIIVALGLYQKLGLIYMQENGYLKIANYENIVGSEWTSAERMRKLRSNEKNLIESHCDTKCDKNVSIDIDKDIEKDIDIYINKENDVKEKEFHLHTEKHKYGNYKHILLTDKEFEKLSNDYPNFQEAIDFLDEYIEMKGYKCKSHYLAIKKWVFDAIKENQQRKDKINGTHKRDFDERKYSDSEINSIISNIDTEVDL